MLIQSQSQMEHLIRCLNSATNIACKNTTYCLDTAGYGLVRVGGKLKKHHRLIWEANNGPIPNNMIVRHKCDNRACIEISHLELGTKKDNARDRDIRGRANTLKGEQHGNSKLTELHIKSIRALDSTGMSLKEVSEIFGISPSTAGKIVSRQAWKHVD